MDGLPVTIRLLDPPLHEFLPDPVELAVELERTPAGPEPSASSASTPASASSHESNPMLGTRGCRLALVYPEIYVMQVARDRARRARSGRRAPSRRRSRS